MTTATPIASAPALTLLFDGLCPICSREIAFLRRRDRAGRLAMVDIAADEFDPRRYGLTMPQVIGAMHGVLPDGRVIVGLEVFRRAYRAVGLGWVMAWTGWPLLRHPANLGYRLFARLRPRLSRMQCTDDRCSITRDSSAAQGSPPS